MVNSNQKGKRGEREWSNFCRDQGYEVSRTQQYCGKTEESADCIGLPGIHQEVKRVQALNLDQALEQAHLDAIKIEETYIHRPNIPIVAHRKNGKPWKVTMYADDWFRLYKEWEAGKCIASSVDNP